MNKYLKMVTGGGGVSLPGISTLHKGAAGMIINAGPDGGGGLKVERVSLTFGHRDVSATQSLSFTATAVLVTATTLLLPGEELAVSATALGGSSRTWALSDDGQTLTVSRPAGTTGSEELTAYALA